MKLNIGKLEVTISVKGQYAKRANMRDTKVFLNYLSILAREASTRYEQVGCLSLAESADELSNAIFDTLDATGWYEDVR